MPSTAHPPNFVPVSIWFSSGPDGDCIRRVDRSLGGIMRDGLRYETGFTDAEWAVLSVDESRVWMGPRLASEELMVEPRACGHVSGLFARRTRPLAMMDVRRLGPHQILGFEAFSSPG